MYNTYIIVKEFPEEEINVFQKLELKWVFFKLRLLSPMKKKKQNLPVKN